MLSKEEVKNLLTDLESDRIERTISFREDKIGPAVCAFSNDYPNHKKPGYIFFGANDDGSIAGMTIGDDKTQNIGGVRSNGNILPQPSLIVSEVFNFDEGDIVVAEVHPSFHPPVRFRGKCWIRVGPRKAVANETEERRLSEKRTSTAKTFDARPFANSQLSDLDVETFKSTYLPAAIDRDTLQANNRTIEEKLSSLRLYDLVQNCVTNSGILLLGLNPLFYLPGAYIQYIKLPGKEQIPEIEFEKRFSGALITELKNLNDFVTSNIVKSKVIQNNSLQEQQIYNYPLWALREFLMNAVMHRDYESNAPILIYEYSDRIEIINSGGLYGEVRPENFPQASDYRNPVIAEVMKNLGYVNRFNFGIQNAQQKLHDNGNPPAEFELDLITKFRVTIKKHPSW
ncbi:ATP-binding protein [Microscilla marina]|uniref:Putative transcriptional regulator n=1 Tax=Microscilla marina ATCC 23134 TaxID=313606 RepID=A1ZDX8_MICM2|nr:ATP-binding protein [Microscilla marina]EAY31286.1 putative transcriptional regulator [Microscilla marina ATCC 23134]